jgi:hypothetical protein
MLNAIMPSVVMNVVVLSAIMLSFLKVNIFLLNVMVLFLTLVSEERKSFLMIILTLSIPGMAVYEQIS